MHKAVFLDKDGTLVTDVPYNVNPSLINIEQGVINGLLALQNSGFLLVIISNQPGIEMGLFNKQELENMMTHLTSLFLEDGVTIAGVYYCPHAPVKENGKEINQCGCRKPSPGLIQQAATELNIDLRESWMVGDILNDVEAGNRAGCRTILINNGNETEWVLNDQRVPDYKADDFLDASNYIVAKMMIRHE